MSATTTYHRYVRAAKLKSADAAAIFMSAKSELAAKQLGQLVSVLRERHGFKLPKRDRDGLIDELLDADLAPTRIANLIGCCPRTVARRATSQVGVTGRLDKRRQRDKTTSRDLPPILSFNAAGGGDDERLIREILNGEAT